MRQGAMACLRLRCRLSKTEKWLPSCVSGSRRSAEAKDPRYVLVTPANLVIQRHAASLLGPRWIRPLLTRLASAQDDTIHDGSQETVCRSVLVAECMIVDRVPDSGA